MSAQGEIERIAEREARRLVESTGVDVESVGVSLICDGLFECTVATRDHGKVRVYLEVVSWEGGDP